MCMHVCVKRKNEKHDCDRRISREREREIREKKNM